MNAMFRVAVDRVLGALLGIMLVSPAESHAVNGAMYSVQDLYEKCKDGPQSSNDYGTCVLFVMAIADLMDFEGGVFEPIAGEPPLSANGGYDALLNVAMCRKAHTTPAAEAQIFVNYAARHPEEWDQPAAIGIMIALRETWPCSPKK